MFGAVIGDIVGSTFEAENHRSIYFEMFRKDARFTDDTVCTAAVADILNSYSLEQLTHNNISNALRLWCCSHITRGFGSMFHQWVLSGVNKPYNSFGNGALMRISPVAMFSKKYGINLEESQKIAKKFTEITHNHPQALKAVEIYNELLFYFLHNKVSSQLAKEKIKETIIKYNYITPLTVEQYRLSIEFDLTCKTSLSVSFASILESESFEEAIRNVVSIGGDSDTYAAITGALAESIWGCEEFLPEIKKYFRQYDQQIIESITLIY